MLERIAPRTGPHASSAYSPALRAGNLVFVSGQGPFDPITGEIDADDIAGQVRRTLENVALLLEAAGSRLDDVVRVDAYLGGSEGDLG
jgi:2-iminobutanoate/2-iminopropanoate deaminase